MRFFSKLVTSLPLIAGACCTTSAAAIRRAVDSDSLVKNLQVLTTQSQELTTALENAKEEEKDFPFVQNVKLTPFSEGGSSFTNTYSAIGRR